MLRRLPENEIELSPRELQVCALVAEGLPNKQIAERLKNVRTKKPLSENTVCAYLEMIYAKAGVRSRTELTMQLLRHGVLKVSPLPTGKHR